ncbi:hypothetical protein [Sporomusa acidovorans]|uniref:hypothetical protein n=1 Tax=Sporomusa acidovorans TaxID=112900 RepID=UPI00087F16AA|nr:hypothetical protein [Sporomusa acidovorans]OZC18950.1 hypothetical protein SPACI_30360 [Sporomusa acidovorans DSM 3132]SDD70195.1 hypothetical protein SAMN04488499_1003124 [Sporomusa acidovorans]
MDRDKALVEEIKIIQDIIKRMNGNSFMIKGWTLTLVVATLLFKVDAKMANQVPIVFIPIILFWFLDAYYLQQERTFREMNRWIANNRLETEEHLFDFSPERFKNNVPNLIEMTKSETVFLFYGSVSILVLIYMFFFK